MRVHLFGVILAVLCACAMFARGNETVTIQVKGKAVAAPCGPNGCPIPSRSLSLHVERHATGHAFHATGLVRGLFVRVADLVAGLVHRTAHVAHTAFDARPRLVARVVHRVVHRVRCR